tara:strand:+ start:733 stop:924 length:192 start_codon:yes stop_codon:yes gene_type:complete
MQDSGMSDSEFMKTQKLIQKKNAKSMAELDKRFADEAMRIRLSDAGNIVRKKTLWQKIKGWLK